VVLIASQDGFFNPLKLNSQDYHNPLRIAKLETTIRKTAGQEQAKTAGQTATYTSTTPDPYYYI
jgi:hypothetical protein